MTRELSCGTLRKDLNDELGRISLWADLCSHAQILGEPEASVGAMLDLFGVHLKPSELRKDVKPLLKTACSAIFGSATGLVDMLTQHVPSSRAGAVTKVRVYRT